MYKYTVPFKENVHSVSIFAVSCMQNELLLEWGNAEISKTVCQTPIQITYWKSADMNVINVVF